MDTILEIIKQFKKQLIVVGALIVVFIVAKTVIPIVQEANANKTPIVDIEASNSKVYKNTEEVKPGDFKIVAIHEDGARTSLGSDTIELSRTTLNPTGGTTTVTVTYKEDTSIYCNVEVEVERKKIIGFQCGYPTVKNVIAVLYSNGELCFEGEGETLTFEKGKYPWLKYDKMKDYPIKSITFEKKVTPRIMDYWFSGVKTLTYVDTIPSSVQSMKATFSGCTGLTTMADWTECDKLLDITECYNGCTGLKYTVAIPSNVTKAKTTFNGCIALQKTPNLSNATSLIHCQNMFNSCDKLVSITMPPNAQYLDGMFANCINLQIMPDIPETTLSMKETFKNCTALSTLSTIPKNVNNMESCFLKCEFIEGTATINASPEKMNNAFKNACVATTLDLNGSSLILDAFANSCEYNNITVNGQQPIKAITSLASYNKYMQDLEKERLKNQQK